MPKKLEKVSPETLLGYVLSLFFAFFLNYLTATSISAKVSLNELMPNPESGSDWVELYADTDEDLSGFIISDEATTDVYTIPDGTVIGPTSGKYFVVDCGSRLNKNSDTIYLRRPDRDVEDEYTYSEYLGPKFSFGRYPDGDDWMKCTPTYHERNDSCNKTSEDSGGTSAPTRSQENDKATLKINEAKDGSGNTLSNVKIYVDGNYLHHYAPETLEFCNGCDCDGYASCSLGEHTIILEKSGYVDWTKTVLVDSGSENLDPVMQNIQEPTDAPTPAPTKVLLPTIKISSGESTDTAKVKQTPVVLGSNDPGTSPIDNDPQRINKDEETAKPLSDTDRTIAALLITIGGVVVLGAAAYPIFAKNGLKLESFTDLLKNEGKD